jgi:hypothetical protein
MPNGSIVDLWNGCKSGPKSYKSSKSSEYQIGEKPQEVEAKGFRPSDT